MNKTLFQGLIIVGVFFSTWFALTHVEWVKVLRVQHISNATEQRLGELFLDVFKYSEKEITNPHVVGAIDSIVNRICITNKIYRENIKIHIFDKEEINAFALPYGNIIIYSGLILSSNNQEELAGVICHEIAHLQLNHVIKKLVKEIGATVLISMTTSSGGLEATKETAKLLSSSSFDRKLEKEADMKAVDYLINANINPEDYANFLYRLSDLDSEASNFFAWISTHPSSKERAEVIISYSKNKYSGHYSFLSNDTWDKMKEELLN